MTSRRDLRALPKAHLHIHLEGAMRRRTLEALCRRYDMQVPADTRGVAFDGFGGFLELFWAAAHSIRNKADLARLITEVAEDAAAEGVWWIEIAFDADRYSELRAGEPHRLFDNQEEGWLFAIECAEAAERSTGVGIAFISAVDRIMPLDRAIKRAEVTRRLVRDGRHWISNGMAHHRLKIARHAAIIGFGLHGNEQGFPPAPFAPAFEIATDGTGLLSLPHAGEIAPRPGGGPAAVRAAIEELGAHRVAHGVLAIEEPALVAELAQRGICLDVAVTSNLMLRVFANAEAHPLPALIGAGVPCTIGSDDPLLFGANLIDEFLLCRQGFGFDDEMLADLARHSFRHSGAPQALKSAGLEAIDRWLAT